MDAICLKAEIRRTVRARRKALDAGQRSAYSEQIRQGVKGVLDLKCGDCVFCYLPVGAEVDTNGIITDLWQRGIEVCVPVVDGDDMKAVRYRKDSVLGIGAKGAPEPVDGEEVERKSIKAIIAPLVAFDGKGNRLGQGGGYYDRFMTSEAIAVGVAFSCQEADFPVEVHDAPLDCVVTECGIRIFNEKYRRKIQR